MRIAIDIRNIGKQRTGDETVFFHLVRELAKIDSKNEYLLLIDRRTKENIQQIEKRLGIENTKNFHITQLGSGNKFLWNGWTVPLFLRREKVDVYHTQYIIPFFVSRRTKIITHIHDVSFKAFPEFIAKHDLFFLNMLIPYALRRSDAVIAVSQFTKDEVVRLYDVSDKKLFVIPNALGDEFIDQHFSSNELESVRKKYDLPKKFLLYVGTLQPRKNIPALVRSFALVREKLPQHNLVLVGNRNAHHFDTSIDKAIQETQLESKVIFPGYVESQDLPKVYALADVFIFPSTYEGFGVPIIEAMSQNIPVIVSDIAIHHEVAGDAVRYVDFCNLEEVSNVVYTMIISQKERDLLIERERSHVALFSWATSAQKLREVYTKIHKS